MLKKDEDLPILNSQEHCCWYPVDTRSQGISRHGIALVMDFMSIWNRLTYCGLVVPYYDWDLGQHCFRWWLVTRWYRAINWTSFDLPSVKSFDNHRRAIIQEIPKPSVDDINLKIASLKCHSYLSGCIELNASVWITATWFHQMKSLHIHGLVQDCSNSSALAVELLQFCPKPSM